MIRHIGIATVIVGVWFGSSALATTTHEVRVLTTCLRCPVGQKVKFMSTISHRDKVPLRISDSRLIVSERGGKVVFETLDPFCSETGSTVHGGRSSNCATPELLDRTARLPIGSYEVVWKVNEIASNRARFDVVAVVHEPPPVEIELLELYDGTYSQESFVARFANPTPEPLDLPTVWESHSVLVDGVPYRLVLIKWAGSSSLGPHRTWVTAIDLRDYWSPQHECVPPGRHTIEIVSGGTQSNSVVLNVPAGLWCSVERSQQPNKRLQLTGLRPAQIW